jgi:hypothetical protein
MKTKTYRMAISASVVLASALILAVQPLSLSAVRAVGSGPTATSAPGDVAGDRSGWQILDGPSAYRQAIEDVLPLMRSLQARGDTVRLAQLARSVIEVWTELESVQPEAVPDAALREEVEAWAGPALATSSQHEAADRAGR